MITRRLPPVSIVLPAASKTHPWKVERHDNRVEHVRGGPRILASRVTYTVTRVGRFRTIAAAESSARRSARKHGGHWRDRDGAVWPIGLPLNPRRGYRWAKP